MSQSIKLNNYLDTIYNAIHAPDFSAPEFLNVIYSVLNDFAQQPEFAQAFDNSTPNEITTTFGPMSDPPAFDSLPIVDVQPVMDTQPAVDVPPVSDGAPSDNMHWASWETELPTAVTIPTATQEAPTAPPPDEHPAAQTDPTPELVSALPDASQPPPADLPPPPAAHAEILTSADSLAAASGISQNLAMNAASYSQTGDSLNGGNQANLPQLNAQDRFTQSFDNSLDNFTHTWGDVKHGVTASGDGYIELTSPASTHENASAMIAPNGPDSGFGFGFYSFTLSTSNSTAGPYALLWPATDTWPGAEIDVFELGGSAGPDLGKPYSTMHHNNNGSDAFQFNLMPGNIDPRDIHTYSVDWSAEKMVYYLDGRPYATLTEHVPMDFAHGGINSVPGVGELTGWWPDQNTTDNSMRLYEFNFIPHTNTDNVFNA